MTFFPHTDTFWCSRQLLKTLWYKEKLVIMRNFLFIQVFSFLFNRYAFIYKMFHIFAKISSKLFVLCGKGFTSSNESDASACLLFYGIQDIPQKACFENFTCKWELFHNKTISFFKDVFETIWKWHFKLFKIQINFPSSELFRRHLLTISHIELICSRGHWKHLVKKLS